MADAKSSPLNPKIDQLKNTARDRLIVALDAPSAARARELARELHGTCQWVKVGLELFIAAGQSMVEELVEQGFSVFLDLKLHDIPNTVAGAVRSAATTGASLLTVHASGGPAMLTAAVEAAAKLPNSPRPLAVTVLTNMDARQLAAVGVLSSPSEQVLRLARAAQACGINGFVCSAEEVGLLRRELGKEAFLVVPGIRPSGSSHDDQKRIAPPGDAIRSGADALVIGRPITQAPDPAKAAAAILTEIAEAMTP